MRSSLLLALISGLLTYALLTAPDTGLHALNVRRQWTPVVAYPAGYSVATCPVVPGLNPYSTLQVPGSTKRSLTTAPRLRRRNNLCGQIAHGNINGFANRVGNTDEVLLIAGATYVFSWALDEFISYVRVWRHNHDGSFTAIQTASHNQGRGNMTLNVDQTAGVHFEIRFIRIYPYGLYDVNGEFALFQTANGNQNP